MVSCGYVFLIAAAVAASSSSSDSARNKIGNIERDRLPPGAHVTLTAQELTAYARDQAQRIAPGAVQHMSLSIGGGHAEGSAIVDLLKVRQANGDSDSWIMRQLLSGGHEVRTRVRIESRAGKAKVDVERVEIGGVTMEGKTLAFLMSQFVIPSFPNARVGEWFELGHRIDRFELRPGAVTVWIAKSGG